MACSFLRRCTPGTRWRALGSVVCLGSVFELWRNSGRRRRWRRVPNNETGSYGKPPCSDVRVRTRGAKITRRSAAVSPETRSELAGLRLLLLAANDQDLPTGLRTMRMILMGGVSFWPSAAD